MVVRDRSFPNGSPVCDYWLSRCEGFTVRAGSRNLGVVERLAFASGGRVQSLVLHRRRRRSRPIEAGQVLAVVPARKLLLARRAHHELPDVRPIAHAIEHGATAVVQRVAPLVVSAVRRGAHETARAVRAEADSRTRQLPSAKLARVHTVANEYAFGLQQPLGRGRNVGPTRSP